jgi:hypothetical protein
VHLHLEDQAFEAAFLLELLIARTAGEQAKLDYLVGGCGGLEEKQKVVGLL